MAGSAVGVAALAVLLVPRLRVLLGLVAVACIVAAGVYVTVHQAQSPVPDNGAWPRSFGAASEWAWAAVVFLGAEGVVDAVQRRRHARLSQAEPVPPRREPPACRGRWRPR